MLQNLRIDGTGETTADVFIDDNRIQCYSVKLDMEAGCVPQATIGLSAAPDFNGYADILLEFTPETVGQAVIILRDELLKHGAYYKAFCDSIQSVLDETIGIVSMDNEYLAEHIMKRVIGEE